MADSSSVDALPDYHAPRPRKPTRIDLLKPHSAEDASRSHLELASGLSRHVLRLSLSPSYPPFPFHTL